MLVSENGTQFCANSFKKFCEDVQIKQRFASVEHPQINVPAESTNQTILEGLKKSLDLAKGD